MAAKGLAESAAALSRVLSSVKTLTPQGLMQAGLIVQRKAQKKVPVHIGKLKANAYTRPTPENAMAVEVGFSAGYALFVHENMEMKWRGKPRRDGLGVYWGPNGTNRFLKKALDESTREVLSTIGNMVKPRRKK